MMAWPREKKRLERKKAAASVLSVMEVDLACVAENNRLAPLDNDITAQYIREYTVRRKKAYARHHLCMLKQAELLPPIHIWSIDLLPLSTKFLPTDPLSGKYVLCTALYWTIYLFSTYIYTSSRHPCTQVCNVRTLYSMPRTRKGLLRF